VEVSRDIVGGLGSKSEKWKLVVGVRKNWAGLKGLSVADRPWQFECMKPLSFQEVVQHMCELRCKVALSKGR